MLRGVGPLPPRMRRFGVDYDRFRLPVQEWKNERHVLASGAELVDDWVMALRAKTSVNRTLHLTGDWAVTGQSSTTSESERSTSAKPESSRVGRLDDRFNPRECPARDGFLAQSKPHQRGRLEGPVARGADPIPSADTSFMPPTTGGLLELGAFIRVCSANGESATT